VQLSVFKFSHFTVATAATATACCQCWHCWSLRMSHQHSLLAASQVTRKQRTKLALHIVFGDHSQALKLVKLPACTAPLGVQATRFKQQKAVVCGHMQGRLAT
jgi:hypothetical protein